MTTLSLPVLDLIAKAIEAHATAIDIKISINTAEDQLSIVIKDNGTNMRRTEGPGMLSLRQAALTTGGSVAIDFTYGQGTIINAMFCLSRIDQMPIGNITSTLDTFIFLYDYITISYTYSFNNVTFTF